MTGFWRGRVFDSSVYSHHQLPFAIDYGDTIINKKEPRMGIKASDLKVGDKIRAVKRTEYGGRVGDTYIVERMLRSYDNEPYGVMARNERTDKLIVMSNGSGNFLARCEKVEPASPFRVGDRVRYRAEAENHGYGGEYTVLKHGTGSFADRVYFAEADGLHRSGRLELAPAVEPSYTVTKRVMTDMTITCASGDGDTIVFGYDPAGSLDDGPRLDIEVKKRSTHGFNGIDIEDIDTLKALHRFIGQRIDDFTKDAK